MYTLIVRNDLNKKAMDASLSLATYLASQGIRFGFVNSTSLYHRDLTGEESKAAREHADLAIILGGDGTILRTAHLLAGCETPMLGINFGNLGFLANSGEEGVIELASAALAGELLEDRRSNLLINVVCEGEEPAIQDELDRLYEEERFGMVSPQDGTRRDFFALNEIAITRGAFGRVIPFSFDVSGIPMASLSGDGVIVASATGSTAYSLAAGGPLVTPNFKGLIIQPIAPHTLTARALLTASHDVVHIDLSEVDHAVGTLPTGAMEQDGGSSLFADGDLLVFDEPVKEVFVRRGYMDTILLYAGRDHFYEHSAETFFD